jgi:uncharacterized protein YodC (DUF2158 family)
MNVDARDELKPGDTVQHKAGGPKMVVVDVRNRGGRPYVVVCEWSEGTTLKRDRFAGSAIEKCQAAD